MIPFIPPKLAPWINFGNDTVMLKDGAPEDVKSLFEKLKADMEKNQDHRLQKQ